MTYDTIIAPAAHAPRSPMQNHIDIASYGGGTPV